MIVNSIRSAIRKSINKGGSVVTTRYAPKFDGVATYIEFDGDGVSITQSETVTIELLGITTVMERRVIDSSRPNSSNIRLQINESGYAGLFFRNGNRAGEVSVDGGDFSVSAPYPHDGGVHTITLRPTETLMDGLLWMQALGEFADSYSEVTLLSITVANENYPLTESFAEYPVLTGSLGSTMTAYNFVESDVVEVEV